MCMCKCVLYVYVSRACMCMCKFVLCNAAYNWSDEGADLVCISWVVRAKWHVRTASLFTLLSSMHHVLDLLLMP